VHTPYNTFDTRDDQIIIAVIGDKFWPAVVDLIDSEDLRNPKFATAKMRLAEKSFIEGKISEVLAGETADYWLVELERARVPCARVNNLDQALSDPQVRHRNMVIELEHPEGGTAEVPGNPIKFSGSDAEGFTSPPLLGVHTKEVFREWTDLPEEKITAGIEAGFLSGGE
jgi:crotonobetainyl-CoA:carnitine CoA-transferase CaiB-like acyl-CoA transferase